MTVLSEDDHLRWSLRTTQQLVARTCAEIARVANDSQWCVSYSGGKDSLVVVALARMVFPTIPIAWFDDEAELPETIAAIETAQKQWGPPWIVLAPRGKHGDFHAWGGLPRLRPPYPGAVMTPGIASDWLRERGISSMLGTRRAENAIRAKRGRCGPGWHAPLYDWSDRDIWSAVAGLTLPLNGLYARLVAAGWPRERCKTVPLIYTLDGSYGPYERCWPADVAAVRRRVSAGG